MTIRNVGEGAARDIFFECSAPVESSNGFVISGLPCFKNGLYFLPPHGKINCYQDEHNPLLPFLQKNDLHNA